MRLIKIIISVFISGILLSSCITSTRVAPKRTIVVTKIHNPKAVVYKKIYYYYSNGNWYRKNRRGYFAVTPPTGITIRRLPGNYKTVTVRKNRYYTYNGVYYKKSNKGYVVVKV